MLNGRPAATYGEDVQQAMPVQIGYGRHIAVQSFPNARKLLAIAQKHLVANGQIHGAVVVQVGHRQSDRTIANRLLGVHQLSHIPTVAIQPGRKSGNSEVVA